jgi:SNF2 family DNA or RNA helicase
MQFQIALCNGTDLQSKDNKGKQDQGLQSSPSASLSSSASTSTAPTSAPPTTTSIQQYAPLPPKPIVKWTWSNTISDTTLVRSILGVPSNFVLPSTHEIILTLEEYIRLFMAIHTKYPHFDWAPVSVVNYLSKFSMVSNIPYDMSDCFPGTIWNDLSVHQQEGIRFILQRQGITLITDEMGLGKTRQAILASYYYQSIGQAKTILVVCPKSAVGVWKLETLKILQDPETQERKTNTGETSSSTSLCTTTTSTTNIGTTNIATNTITVPTLPSTSSTSSSSSSSLISCSSSISRNLFYYKESDIACINKGPEVERILSRDKMYRMIIITYGLLRNPVIASRVKNYNCDILIADECHSIKNYESQQSCAVDNLSKSIKYKLLISGTPLNLNKDLYSQLSILHPRLFPQFFVPNPPKDIKTGKSLDGSDFYFAWRYCEPKEMEMKFNKTWSNNSSKQWEIKNSANTGELHAVCSYLVMIRRCTAVVDPTLEKLKNRQRLPVKVSPEWIEYFGAQKKIVAKLREEDFKKAEATFLENWRLSAEAKLPDMLRLIEEMVKTGEFAKDPTLKWILFGYHKSVLDAVEDTMKLLNVKSIRIDGKTPTKTRQNYTEMFQTDPTVRVAILNIISGGESITLTAGTVEWFLEYYADPNRLLQAEKRSHRTGQKRMVSIRYLHAVDTPDDNMWRLLMAKLKNSTIFLDGEAKPFHALYCDDTSELKEVKRKKRKRESLYDHFSDTKTNTTNKTEKNDRDNNNDLGSSSSSSEDDGAQMGMDKQIGSPSDDDELSSNKKKKKKMKTKHNKPQDQRATEIVFEMEPSKYDDLEALYAFR